MSASERAAELRALADLHEGLGALEDAHAAAVEAYRAAPDEETKAAYRAASQALSDHRSGIRSSGLMVADATPGSVTIGTPSVGANAKVN